MTFCWVVVQSALAQERPDVAFRVNNAFVEDHSHLRFSIDVQSTNGVDIGLPSAVGMSFEVLDETQMRLSDHIEQTIRFGATADSGSYVVYPPSITWDGHASVLGNELFVDIGQAGPRSTLAPRMERDTRFSVVWSAIPVLLVVGMLSWRYRRRRRLVTDHVLLEKPVLLQTDSDFSEKISQFRLYLEQKGLGRFTVLTLREVNQSLFTEEWEHPTIKPLIQEVLEVGEQLRYAGQRPNELRRTEVCAKMKAVIGHLEER